MIYCTLGELLIKLKMTQKQLSLETGIGQNAISKYCNNTWLKFDKEHLKILCAYFKCDTTALIKFFPIKDGLDEETAKRAIRYQLLRQEYNQVIDEYLEK